MSLNRTALRLGVVLALTNNNQPPYPTLAEGRVMDSRLDPIQGTKPEEQVPLIVVYTDDDDGDTLSENNGGPPFRRVVELGLWLAICQRGKDGEEPYIGYTETDAELEAMLDLFEHQVKFAFSNPENPWSVLLAGEIIIRLLSWQSDRYVLDENVKLAARNVTIKVEIAEDDFPMVVPQLDASPPLPGSIQKLLAAVGEGSTGYVKSTIDLLKASGVPNQVTLPDLQDIRMHQSVPEGVPGTETRAENLADVTLTAVPLAMFGPVLGRPVLSSP